MYKYIAASQNLDQTIHRISDKEAFITVKYHKPYFEANSTFHLINTEKKRNRKIIKIILEHINTKLRKSLELNQLKTPNPSQTCW